MDGDADRRTFHFTLVSVFSDSNNDRVDRYDLWSERMTGPRASGRRRTTAAPGSRTAGWCPSLGRTGIGLGAVLGNTTVALDVYAKAGFRQLYSAERYSLQVLPG